jgi:hypothetical protein
MLIQTFNGPPHPGLCSMMNSDRCPLTRLIYAIAGNGPECNSEAARPAAIGSGRGSTRSRSVAIAEFEFEHVCRRTDRWFARGQIMR